jgi:hypothetical protein
MWNRFYSAFGETSDQRAFNFTHFVAAALLILGGVAYQVF